MINTKQLEAIGLTKGEASVYLALVRLGASSTGPLADESGVSRSKIYAVLNRLMKKGLVTNILRDRVRHYRAEDPQCLNTYVEKQEETVLKNKKAVALLIPFLTQANIGVESTRDAQIYEGFKGIQTMHEHTYDRLSFGEEYCYLGISPPTQFEQKNQEWYWHKDHKRRIASGIHCRLLFNQGTDKNILLKRNTYKGCESRYLPISVVTPAWILVYKNVTAIGMQGEKPIGVEIISKEIADSFRLYFESFWKLSKKIRK